MAQLAAPSPDAHRPLSRTVASCRLFSPEFPLLLPFAFLFFPASQLGSRYWLGLSCWPTTNDRRPTTLFMLFPECFDLHIHSSRKIELHQRVHGLRRRIENIQQTLVRADLELLPRFLVHVRRTQHRVFVLHRRQWNRTSDLSAGTLRRSDDFRGGLIEHAIIVCLQSNANFFVSYHVSFS